MIEVIEKMQPEESAQLWEMMSKTSSNEELQKIIKEMVYGLDPEEHQVESNGESDAQSGEDNDSHDQSSKKITNKHKFHVGPRDDVESNGESDAQSGEDNDSNNQSSKKKQCKKKKATNQHTFHVPKAWSLFLRSSGEFSQLGGKPMPSNLMTIGMINDFICHVYVSVQHFIIKNLNWKSPMHVYEISVGNGKRSRRL